MFSCISAPSDKNIKTRRPTQCVAVVSEFLTSPQSVLANAEEQVELEDGQLPRINPLFTDPLKNTELNRI